MSTTGLQQGLPPTSNGATHPLLFMPKISVSPKTQDEWPLVAQKLKRAWRLQELLGAPLDILYEIFSFLEPQLDLRLAWTSKLWSLDAEILHLYLAQGPREYVAGLPGEPPAGQDATLLFYSHYRHYRLASSDPILQKRRFHTIGSLVEGTSMMVLDIVFLSIAFESIVVEMKSEFQWSIYRFFSRPCWNTRYAQWEHEQLKASTNDEDQPAPPGALHFWWKSFATGQCLEALDINSPLTPVPLPAPSHVHANKHEPRATGSLVAHWTS
ncbi:hypothetical protein C8J56DRAFT_1094797 [Mycena floridula]|nr:hypothetical protein C8J56DRAFT_1094797 [Mycena floridula]